MHNNLFQYAADEREVYADLQRDAGRDVRVRQVLNLVTVLAGAYLARDLAKLDVLAVVLCIWSALAGLQYFIDESNRNFWMHQIDWSRATRERD